MASVPSPPLVEQDVVIRFSEAVLVKGAVMWVEEDRIGVRLKDPINVPTLLSNLTKSSPNGSGYRSPRLKVECKGEFIVHSERRPIDLVDISQRGFKAHIAAASIDDEGIVALPGMEPLRAVVRWVKDGTAGFYFVDPINIPQLGNWIMNVPKAD